MKVQGKWWKIFKRSWISFVNTRMKINMEKSFDHLGTLRHGKAWHFSYFSLSIRRL
jgi:hypothetical protein